MGETIDEKNLPINKWYNKVVPTQLGVLIITLIAVICGFVIIWVFSLVPSTTITNVYMPPVLENQNDEWVTYRNEEYGFEFKYHFPYIYESKPEDFDQDDEYNNFLRTSSSLVVSVGVQNPFFTVFVGNGEEFALNYTKLVYKKNNGNVKVEEDTPYTYNGNTINRIRHDFYLNGALTSSMYVDYINRNNHQYVLEYYTPLDDEYQVRKILDSFKFIN